MSDPEAPHLHAIDQAVRAIVALRHDDSALVVAWNVAVGHSPEADGANQTDLISPAGQLALINDGLISQAGALTSRIEDD